MPTTMELFEQVLEEAQTPPSPQCQLTFPTRVIGSTPEYLQEPRKLTWTWVEPVTTASKPLVPLWVQERWSEWEYIFASQTRQYLLYHEIPPAWRRAASTLLSALRVAGSNFIRGAKDILVGAGNAAYQVARVMLPILGLILFAVLGALVMAIGYGLAVGLAGMFAMDPILCAVLDDGRVVELARWK